MRAKQLAQGSLFAMWLGGIAVGMGLLYDYSAEAGEAADAPETWPGAVQLERSATQPTLVMVVHPQCSCSRASLSELARLVTRLQGQMRVYVLLLRPEGVDQRWVESDLYARATSLDGVEVVVDPGGLQAELFGAKTSGQTYLYGADGSLLFRGGITPTRAHEGDSVGRRRIVALVTGGAVERDVSDVFGCPLQDEAAEEFVLAGWR